MVQRANRSKLFRGFSSTNKITPRTETFDIDLVKNDILNHFSTAKGERLMRPNFGSIIWDLLFEPYDDTVRDEVIADVEDIVGLDSRVTLQSVDVIEFEHGLRVNVAVIYHPIEALETFDIEFDRRNRIGEEDFSSDLTLLE